MATPLYSVCNSIIVGNIKNDKYIRSFRVAHGWSNDMLPSENTPYSRPKFEIKHANIPMSMTKTPYFLAIMIIIWIDNDAPSSTRGVIIWPWYTL